MEGNEGCGGDEVYDVFSGGREVRGTRHTGVGPTGWWVSLRLPECKTSVGKGDLRNGVLHLGLLSSSLYLVCMLISMPPQTTISLGKYLALPKQTRL